MYYCPYCGNGNMQTTSGDIKDEDNFVIHCFKCDTRSKVKRIHYTDMHMWSKENK